MNSLKNKKILVIGASSGIGLQTAKRLSEQGASLILSSRNEAKLSEALRQMEGSSHTIIPCDLTNEADIKNLVTQLPQLNGVVFSSGIASRCPAGFITSKEISENFGPGFNGAVLLFSGLIRKKKLIQNNCSIVFVSSSSTNYPFVGGAMYVAVKAAIEGYAKVLALELVSKGIRVNCVAPAFVSGPMFEQVSKETSPEIVTQIKAKQPMGLGSPDDVASSILFLLSDDSKWISGSRLTLGGG